MQDATELACWTPLESAQIFLHDVQFQAGSIAMKYEARRRRLYICPLRRSIATSND
jgi:hypothetical protein